MSKPYTEKDLSNQFDADLIWRRKELSDIKLAISNADKYSKSALLRALITVVYAHWEGYVRTCANRYFEHLALRKKRFIDLERQVYVNVFLAKLNALSQSKVGIEARCQLINELLDGTGGRFSYINPDLIDTRSNLNADVIKDICVICAVDGSHFESRRSFIDFMIVKRRNAIAHGQQELIIESGIDDLVTETLALMDHFRSLLENKVYTKGYLAA
jgi:RiboL-PSP-HEPN